MPLTDKGKKIMKAMKKEYGKKKGEQVFYASRNKGKIKGVEKLKFGGGADMGASSRDKGMGMGGKTGSPRGDSPSRGDGRSQPTSPTVTANKGPKQIQVNTMMKYAFPTTSLAIAGINKLSRDLYNQKNLAAQKKVDVLGGEMLTTRGPRRTNITQGGGNDSATSAAQPVQPIIMNKPVDQSLIKPKENFFNFKAFNVGGLSGGVRSGPPPKRGPNPNVPPVKMKRGGYNK